MKFKHYRRIVLCFAFLGLAVLAVSGYIYRSRVSVKGGLPRAVYVVMAEAGARRYTEARLAGGFPYTVYMPQEPRRVLLRPARGPVLADSASDEETTISDRRTRGSGGLTIANLINAEGLRYWNIGSESVSRGTREGMSSSYYRATVEILEGAEKQPSPESRRARAILKLVEGELVTAIEELESAREQWPKDAALLNDLAALYLERAQTMDEPRDFIRALSVIDEAVSLDPSLIEAKFNLALILENVFLYPTAREKWQEYLKVGRGEGEWVAEAQAHIAKIDTPPPMAAWPQERAKLDAAALQGDEAKVMAIVKRFPHPARVYAINELLPMWADAMYEKREADAEIALTILSLIGVSIASLQNDNLIRDAAIAIDALMKEPLSTGRLELLVAAHLDYRNGRNLFDRNENNKASIAFNNARVNYEKSGDTAGAVLASLESARCEINNLNYERALSIFNELRLMANNHSYKHMTARYYWLISYIQHARVELTPALNSARSALPVLELSGDIEGMASVYFLIGEIFDDIKEIDEIWHYQYKANKLLTKIEIYPRKTLIYTGMASEIARMGEPKAALYFHNEAVRLALLGGNAVFTVSAFVRRSLIHHNTGNQVAALSDLESAKYHLANISDPKVHNTFMGDISIVEGNYKLSGDPQSAARLFSSAIKAYEHTAYLYRANNIFISRARAYLALGEFEKAEADIKTSIEEYERRRRNIAEEQHRISFFEEPQSVYDEMIRFQVVQRNNLQAGFDYSETARARTLLDLIERRDRAIRLNEQPGIILDGMARPLSLSQIQSEIPKDVDVVEYSLLTDRLLAWVVKQDSIRLVQTTITSDEIERMAHAFRKGLDNNIQNAELARLSSALYEKLIRPLETYLAHNSTVIIIPDKELHIVPFAALMDSRTGRYLIEDHAIAISPSASVFVRCLQRDRKLAVLGDAGALAIGNPKFERANFPNLSYLPAAELEANKIAGLYPGSELLISERATKLAFLSKAGRHTVVHFAGHSLMEVNSPLFSSLILAPYKGAPVENNDSALYAYELYSANFARTRLMVLAACKTASGKYSHGEGVASIARPFLAAGVPAVIASLWDTNDQAASIIFPIFHEKRIAGEDSARALRAAQLALLNNADSKLRLPSMWSSFVLLGGNATVNKN